MLRLFIDAHDPELLSLSRFWKQIALCSAPGLGVVQQRISLFQDSLSNPLFQQ